MNRRSPRKRPLPAASLIAAVALAVAGEGLRQTAHAELVLEYDVRYGPLTILAVQARADVTAETYRATTEMRTVGVVGWWFPWTSTATSLGHILGADWRPTRHRLQGNYRSVRRIVEIDYDATGPVRAVVEPAPQADWRTEVPDPLRRATVDPLTASLAAARIPCDRTLAVFDGRRRYNMHLRPLDAQPPAHVAAIAAGPARGCRADIEALAGFWVTDPRTSETPTYLDFWIAVPDVHVGPVPVGLYLSGPAGALDIRLTAATRTQPPDA
ncbi:DUF3108 domain-containing protein [Candidatus Binatia bacterium]|nr:DUF3108 domain-containing protein [Candidatus Binatia bacterium]